MTHQTTTSTSGCWPAVTDNRSLGVRCISDVDGNRCAAGERTKTPQASLRRSLRLQQGSVTFTAGDETIETTGGQVVVVPAGVAHKFMNSGTGRLRQVDMHASERFVTEWLEV
jgi:hypothetical protein